jgi:hypothetical protein
MNYSMHSVFTLMKKVLREDVKAELRSDHATTQLAGVLDILEKLERQLVPSPDLLRKKLAILRSASAEAGGTFAPEPTDQASLEQAVRDGEAELRRLTDVAFDTGDASLHRLLQATLRKLLQVERSAVPRADFGAMTSGSNPAAPGNGEK